MIMEDLRSFRPFKQVEGRHFESFKDISYNPASPLNEEKFLLWINRHKSNILKHFPVSEDSEESTEEECSSDGESSFGEDNNDSE